MIVRVRDGHAFIVAVGVQLSDELFGIASGNDFIMLIIEKDSGGAALMGQRKQIEAERVVVMGCEGFLEEGNSRTHQ